MNITHPSGISIITFNGTYPIECGGIKTSSLEIKSNAAAPFVLNSGSGNVLSILFIFTFIDGFISDFIRQNTFASSLLPLPLPRCRAFASLLRQVPRAYCQEVNPNLSRVSQDILLY